MIEGSYSTPKDELAKRAAIKETRELTLLKIQVMLSFATGKEVEVKIRGLKESNWVHAPKPCWDWHTCEFRTKND